MAKVKPYYEEYSIDRSMKYKVNQISNNVYEVINNKGEVRTVINNKKNLRCDCKFANDNKLHIKYCACCLAVLHFIDKRLFWAEIKEKERNREK